MVFQPKHTTTPIDRKDFTPDAASTASKTTVKRQNGSQAMEGEYDGGDSHYHNLYGKDPNQHRPQQTQNGV